jgi:hypothetical protein
MMKTGIGPSEPTLISSEILKIVDLARTGQAAHAYSVPTIVQLVVLFRRQREHGLRRSDKALQSSGMIDPASFQPCARLPCTAW